MGVEHADAAAAERAHVHAGTLAPQEAGTVVCVTQVSPNADDTQHFCLQRRDTNLQQRLPIAVDFIYIKSFLFVLGYFQRLHQQSVHPESSFVS